MNLSFFSNECPIDSALETAVACERTDPSPGR